MRIVDTGSLDDRIYNVRLRQPMDAEFLDIGECSVFFLFIDLLQQPVRSFAWVRGLCRSQSVPQSSILYVV